MAIHNDENTRGAKRPPHGKTGERPRGKTPARSADARQGSRTERGNPRGRTDHDRAKPRPERQPRPTEKMRTPDDICWGRNPVQTLLEDSPKLCTRVYLLTTIEDDELAREISTACAQNGIPLERTDRATLDALTAGANNQGIAARIKPIPTAELDDLIARTPSDAPSLVVILDHCQDPHNLGAVIRTAEIAGALCVVCQKDRSATVNGTVIKTSAGAAFRLPVVQAVNVNRTLEKLKESGYWVVGLDHRTEEQLWQNPLPERLALVIGAEGEGISPLVAKNCDKLVKIPMAGSTGNLNASVAAAIGMFEWYRTSRPQIGNGSQSKE